MLKKVVCLIMALTMVGCLAACGGTGTETAATQAATQTQAGTEATVEETTGAQVEGYFDVIDDSVALSTTSWYRGDITVYETAQGNFTKKTDDGTLVIGSQGTITYCDPAQTQQEYNFSFNVYDSLINVNRVTGEYEPCLATEWEYDDDGNLHITLRENVKFHDGTIMNADDVIYTLKRITNNPKCKAYEACCAIDFDKTIIEDDTHLVIAFNKVYGSFIGFLASNFTGILSKEFMEEVGEDYSFLDGDAGCGAYKLVETVTGLSQKFVRFEDYWGGCPAIETIDYRRYEDKTAMGIDYENGDLDVLLYSNYDTANLVATGDIIDTVMYRVPNNRSIEITMNTNDGPLADVNLRQALACCVDWEQVVYAVNGSLALGSVATSVFQPGIKYTIETGAYEYDPDKAIELVEKAGYSVSNPVTIKVLSSSGTSNEDAAAEIIQQYAKAVGIKIEIELGKSGDLNTKLSSTDAATHDIIMKNTDVGAGIPATWLVGRDVFGKDEGTYNVYKGINNEEFHNLCVAAEATLDEDERAAIYAEMQELIHENVWYMDICPNNSYCLFRDYVNIDVEKVFLGGQTVLWSAISIAE